MEFNKDKWIKDGVIANMPKKQQDKYKLFVYLASDCFEERKYTEKEINEILKRYYGDFCYLRRYMVDFKILKRTDDGKEYRFNK
ncbi:MAG: DUF2087 domain-containing protein [Peptoniphilaceae bacterium]|uniref:DUF2087 domain-containing protein n=1 Tax=Parvimonas sp. TaxID=1944660 RepID=UPI0025E8D52E|nr:DUF2087 domain-containing protein [Parvimonas sp.]MCI5997321.1 DUF2087 domain-containing protein [Parvimonas sp.]MDD7764473.1 DUF2087 domain-containing protein [Peptoniphilaceae bacterium]MDY3051126.1 DUF2087 domain-containing protein [Parvimonas sp.]